MKKLIRTEIVRCQPASKKTSFTHLPSCILLSFSQKASPLLLSKRFWKCASTISLRKYMRKVLLLVIYQFSDDSSKSTFFILNMIVYKDVCTSSGNEWYNEWQRMPTSGTMNDREGQRVVPKGTTVVQRMTTSDNE